MNRRDFIKTSAVLAFGLGISQTIATDRPENEVLFALQPHDACHYKGAAFSNEAFKERDRVYETDKVFLTEVLVDIDNLSDGLTLGTVEFRFEDRIEKVRALICCICPDRIFALEVV